MKKTNIYSLLLLGLIASVASCRDKGVEIVEQDPSYTLDANVISVDIPKPFVFNDNNIVRYDGSSTELLTTAKVKDNSEVTMNTSSFELNFTLRRPFTEPTDFVLEEDKALLENYRGVKAGFKDLPANTVSGLSFTIPKDQTNFRITLQVQNLPQLNTMPGYLTAYRLRPAKAVEKLQISETAQVFYLKIRVRPTPLGNPNNVMEGTGIEPSWHKLSAAHMKLDQGPGTNSSSINKLIDGNVQTNSWYGNPSSLINFNFTRPRTVAGIAIVTRSSSYFVKGLKIDAAEDEVTLASQGSVADVTPRNGVIYVKFSKPIETDKLKLYDFQGNNRYSISIEEIEIYTLD